MSMSNPLLSLKFSNTMPHLLSKKDSYETSPDFAGSLFDLNLPLVEEGNEPLSPGNLSWEAQMAHARFLIATKTPEYWERRSAMMHAEPFVL